MTRTHSMRRRKIRQSRTMSVCPNCNSTMLRGICQKCGWFRRCAGCKRVLLPGYVTDKRVIGNDDCKALGLQASDGYCPDCLLIVCHGDVAKRDRVLGNARKIEEDKVHTNS